MSTIQNSSGQNPGHRHPAIRAITLLACLGLACCTPPAPQPTPPPPAPPPVTVTLPPSPAPEYDNWLDAPASAGNWTYRDGVSSSFALFGVSGEGARFGMECRKADRTVRLVRAGSSSNAVPMNIRTETAQRTLTAQPSPGGQATVVVDLPASDRLLDAMAFSRGRFAVETSGLEPLYIPAWAEVTRVIEDCR